MSGRITATLPLPAAASGLSCDITEKVRSNCDAEIWGTDTLLDFFPVPGELDPELHAAATTAKLAAIETQAIFLVTCCNETTRFVPGRMRPPFIGTGLRVPQRLLFP